MVDFHVAPDGRDDFSGSLEAALTAARAISGDEPRRIILRGGDYYDVALTFEPKDSGLTVEAAPGETPVLYGGRKLTGWTEEEAGLWSIDLPEVREGTWDFRHLLVDGELRPQSRFPEKGVLRHLSRFDVVWLSTTAGGWERKPTEEERTTLIYRPGDIEPWPDILSAEITIYHQWDDSTVGVKSVDEETRTIHFSTPSQHAPGAFLYYGNPKSESYVIWNIRAGLTKPGQWCLDREAGKLYYRPLAGEDMSSTPVIAPIHKSVITLDGLEETPLKGITLRGLTISGATTSLIAGGFAAARLEAAVTGKFTESCALDNLVIKGVGGQAIKLVRCNDLDVTNCRISDTGAGGIYVFHGDGVRIDRNHVHHVGVSYPSAEGIYVLGRGFEITHNLIHDITYTAVGTAPSDSLIEGNFFYNTMTMLDDGAAIYVNMCRNVTIRGNVTLGTSGGIAHAYYLDEQTEDSLVESNLALDTGWPTHNHMSRHNTIRGNFFIDRLANNPNADDGPMLMSFHRCGDFAFEENIVSAPNGIRIVGPEADPFRSFTGNTISLGSGGSDFELEFSGNPPIPWSIPKSNTIAAQKLDFDPADFRHAGIDGWPEVSTVKTTLRLLKESVGTAKLKLEVTNLGTLPASGERLLWSSPPVGVIFREGETFAYDLAPMERAAWEITVEFPHPSKEGIMVGYQTPGGLGMFKGAMMLGKTA